MTQTQTLAKKPLAEIGEEIGLELGASMINDFQVSHPKEIQSFVIGRNVIDQILAQPGCVGIKLYNALNEKGEKTLVYLGVDKNGNNILEFSVINNQGILDTKNGIVADRIRTGDTFPSPIRPISKPGADDWGLSND